MKLSLIATQGKSQGKAIPVTLSQFIIGRDAQCQLRPASPMISKRHCALLVRGEQAFVRDFDSTNGTLLNDEPIKGEHELKNNDRLKIGPLVFVVRLEGSQPPPKPTAAPSPKPAAASDEEDLAAMLLDASGDPVPPEKAAEVSGTIPTDSTVFDVPPLQDPNAKPPDTVEGKTMETASDKPRQPVGKKQPAKPAGDTSAAAKAILDKLTRRPRSTS